MVSADGTFYTPLSSSVAVVYVDLNNNKLLDRYAEPSGNCELRDNSWLCLPAFKQVTIQRSMTYRGSESNDQTLVVLEDFDLDGTLIADSKICVEHRCTASQDAPFIVDSSAPGTSEKLRAFAICGPEGFKPQVATWTRMGRDESVALSRPQELDARLSDVQADKSRGLKFHLDIAHFDTIIVWAGSLDPTTRDVAEVYWTSEADDVEVSRDSTGAHVSVPARIFNMCASDTRCEVVVQAVKYWPSNPPGVVSATEWRSTVGFRELI